MITLGIDPGRSAGGLAVVDTTARVVLLAHDWRTLRRVSGDVLALRTWVRGQDAPDVSEVPDDDPPPGTPWPLLDPRPIQRAAVEGIRWQGEGGPSTIVLAESAGAAAEWCRLRLRLQPERPTAAEWRRVVLGLPARTPADVAERAAKAATIGPRAVLPALPEWAPGHLAEAVCIAWWAGLRQA